MFFSIAFLSLSENKNAASAGLADGDDLTEICVWLQSYEKAPLPSKYA